MWLSNRGSRKWIAVWVFGASLSASSVAIAGKSWIVPDFNRVQAEYLASENALLDRNRNPIQEIRGNRERRRLKWTTLAEISPGLIDAVLISEDKRFMRHSGVDWIALGKASVDYLRGEKERGASTLSMQLAGMLRGEKWKLKWQKGRRTVFEKLGQVFDARELEGSWSKNQILEAYLNLVSFKGELQGVSSASWGLFGKAPSGLGFSESLILSALIRAPEARPTDVLNRACLIGKSIQRGWNCNSLPSSISIRNIPLANQGAPHLAQRAQADALGTGDIQTTLDSQIQKEVLEILQRQVLLLKSRNVHDAAALVVDHHSGAVLSYVGGIGPLASSAHVDGVIAHRQAGSTLKPFLYGLAIEKRVLTSGSLLDDLPSEFPVFGGIYQPKNYDNDFKGRGIPLKVALASSLNVPAVKTLSLLGVEAFIQKLGQLRFSGTQYTDFYGPSLALGAMDVSLWELVQAYQTIAHGGVLVPLHWRAGGPLNPARPHRVFTPQTSFILTQMLSDREARALGFGFSSVTNTRVWTAVKTGTSKDMRDNWCIGSSDRYTVGVWLGNSSGESMWNVSGVMGAAPAWAEIMGNLHRARTSREPLPPQGIVRREGNWYLDGTEKAHEMTPQWVKIQNPTAGEWIALDPDIPAERQQIELRANGEWNDLSALEWRLDGLRVGSAAQQVMIPVPAAGHHVLTLAAKDGTQPIDRRDFWVRR